MIGNVRPGFRKKPGEFFKKQEDTLKETELTQVRDGKDTGSTGTEAREEKVTGEKTKILRFPGGSSNLVSAKYTKGIMSSLTKKGELIRSYRSRGYVFRALTEKSFAPRHKVNN